MVYPSNSVRSFNCLSWFTVATPFFERMRDLVFPSDWVGSLRQLRLSAPRTEPVRPRVCFSSPQYLFWFASASTLARFIVSVCSLRQLHGFLRMNGLDHSIIYVVTLQVPAPALLQSNNCVCSLHHLRWLLTVGLLQQLGWFIPATALVYSKDCVDLSERVRSVQQRHRFTPATALVSLKTRVGSLELLR